jgi:hypothetical protein
MNHYRQTASQLGRPIDPQTVELLAADTTRTIVTVRNTSHTIYVQRLTYVPHTVAAQAISIQDASTGKKLGLIPASQATPYTIDLGELGYPNTAGENLRAVPAAAGPAGQFNVEGYQKLTSTVAFDSTAANG